jgi:DNA transformation protein
MFGGHGLYAGGVFFGILHGERLFFRTNERTRKRYEACGMECFTAPGSGKALKHYYEVPFGVVENRLELIEWALESIGISGI